jgi:spore maturation protein SpmB
MVREIEIEGKIATALFDNGSMHTYVVNRFFGSVPIRRLSEPYKVALGGRIIEVREYCAIEGKILA